MSFISNRMFPVKQCVDAGLQFEHSPESSSMRAKGVNPARLVALLLLSASLLTTPMFAGINQQRVPKQTDDAVETPSVQREPLGILDRAASELPRAEPGTWKSWTRDEAPPEALRPMLIRGARAYSGGVMPEALTHFCQALEAAPDYPPLLHQVGVIHFRLRRYGDAAELFERFLLHAPGQMAGTRALGHCYYSLGRYAQARDHYRLVLKASPDQVEAIRGLALSEMRLGEPVEALVLLARVLELSPKHAEACAWQAQILYDEELLEEALVSALRAQVLAPFDPRPAFLLSRIYYELEREDDAAAFVKRFEQLDKTAQEVRFVEAKLLLDPSRAELWIRKATATAQIQDRVRTREALRRLLALAPADHTLAIFALDLLEGMGDSDGAAVAARALETNCGHIAESWKRLETYFAKRRDRTRQIQAGESYRRLRDERDG
ncbi:MAG: tetratricopeptide (TPR) repeat protein [Planctomycetota bacterium]|jgi:tetratricopeptide (TPR) repeat protein